MRFDMRAPGRAADEVAALYRTAVEMSAWADARGCAAIAVSEHHASADGYLGSPLVLASAIAAVTERVPIMVAAALLPLYDPMRLAEEMIVLDHLSRGRVMYTLGLGYRRAEYELFGVDFERRGAIADEKLAALLAALRDAGEPAGGGLHLTPAPYRPGGPFLTWGGATKAAARRAGRNGLGFVAQTDDPALGEAYRAAATSAGHAPGLCVLPSVDEPMSVFVHPDVDTGWREVGSALLADATSYYEWNAGTGRADTTASLSSGSTVDELRRADGSHRVVTVGDAVALIRRFGPLSLQPLCGGLDPELAWTYLRRVVEDVIPALAQA